MPQYIELVSFFLEVLLNSLHPNNFVEGTAIDLLHIVLKPRLLHFADFLDTAKSSICIAKEAIYFLA